MSDTNDILRKLAAQAGGEAALSALERALSSADGRRAVSSLSASHEALLRAAADRAASGDLSLPVRSHAASPPPRRAQSSPTPCAAAWEGRAVDNDALSGLLNDPEALQNALRSVSSLLGRIRCGRRTGRRLPGRRPGSTASPGHHRHHAERPRRRPAGKAGAPERTAAVRRRGRRVPVRPGAPPRRHGRHGARRAGTARAPRRRRRAFCITVIWPRARRPPHPKRRRFPRSCHRCRALTATRSSRSPPPFFC